MSEKRKRADYTEDFKRDAVNLVVNQGYSSGDVGRRLGVPISNVTRWVREHKARSLNGVTQREIEAENRRLKKENKRLRMEREILKKAAAFFAKESN
jgi:transposase